MLPIYWSSDIVRIIFDHYYLVHGEWMKQNILIQTVDASDEDKYINLRESDTFSFDQNKPSESIWRMYPDPEYEGFILRPADINEAENITESTKFLGIFT